MKHIIIGVIVLLSSLVCNSQEIYKRTLKLMGSRFDITVVASNKAQGNAYIDLAVAEISRIENLISSWDSRSQTSLINRNSGIKPVIIDLELFNLIKRAIQLSKLTDGAFDITYASMDKIWKFDGSMITMPLKTTIVQSVTKVGYQNIVLNAKDHSVYLNRKEMKIGFGGIGKGYAADKAKALLKKHGVESGIINASGDMSTWGKQPNSEKWNVGITNPLNKNKVFALLPIQDQAVVTSGNYEKYVILDGQRYSHIIDPRTGFPSKGIVSVSVFAPSAELADAIATSIFVMGRDVGINLINQLDLVECIIVDDLGKVYYSKNIDIERYVKEN